MKKSHLTIATLIGLLLLSPFTVMTAHHNVDKAANVATKFPNDEGTVIAVINTTGYTYMELENGKNRFWIAAPTTKVEVGAHIRFMESQVMHNFSSPTLNRTFNRIIFVSSTMVKK